MDWIDVYNTTFSDDYKLLYRNDGDANITDVSYQMGIAEIYNAVSWMGQMPFSITTTMDGKT